MDVLKKNLKLNLRFYEVILLIFLGIFISLAVNTIFLHVGLLQIKTVPIEEKSEFIKILAFIIKILASVVIGPIAEEILFRGFLFEIINKRLKTVISAIITTLIFSVLHLNIVTCLFSLVVGIIFIYYYIKTKNLVVPIIIHSICNLTSIFVLFLPRNTIFMVLHILGSVILIILCNKYIKQK